MAADNNKDTQNKKRPVRKMFISELAQFIWKRKAYWLLPVILVLILAVIAAAGTSSPVSPFLYTLI